MRKGTMFVTGLVVIAGIVLAEHYVMRDYFKAFYLYRTSCCDGVISISQKRALDGGVTPSDAPGFPVTIDHGGSFRLITNLTISHADTTAIEIIKTGDLVRGVTVDLNGFKIEGPGGPPNGIRSSLACLATGSGKGINGPNFGGGQGTAYITIKNGGIYGMGDEAISCSRCIVDGIVANSNGGGGVSASEGTVTNSIVSRNCGDAIRAEIATGNAVRWNKGFGIQADLIQGNAINDNGGIGAMGGLVLDNTIDGNEGAAMLILGGGYGGNLISGTPVLDPVSSANQVGGNVCNGSATCP